MGGFSFRHRELKAPMAFYDLMSYCGPKWIHRYHFEKALAYRLENESRWWNAAADIERPEIIADPVDGFPALVNEIRKRTIIR